MPEQRALMLRTCNADMTAYGGFVWPEEGYVECPDWDPAPRCGHGLHGFLWGEGDSSLASWDEDAKWLVVEFVLGEEVDLNGEKIKVPRGWVVPIAKDRQTATRYIADNGGAGKAIIGFLSTAGYRGTATAGDYGTATAGDYGTATAGYHGTATAGYHGTATAGEGGELRIRWWNGRYRTAVAYVGEDGIKVNTAYRLNKCGIFVEVA